MNTYKMIKFTSLKFWVFLYFVLMLGQGASLVAIYDPRINPIGISIYIFCIFYLLSRKKKRNITPSKTPLLLSFKLLLVIWFLTHLLFLDGGFPLMPYSFFVLHIITGILIIKVYHKDIILYYEKSLVFLSIISLFFWLIEQLGGSYILLNSPVLFENSAGNSDCSLVLYTIGGASSTQEGYGTLFRNHGCAWEPGLFSVMLNIAIVFNVFRNGKFQLRNTNLLILLLALITTFSTTGYIVFIVFLGVNHIFSKQLSTNRRIVYMFVICLLSVTFYSLPFISNKIINAADSSNFSVETESYLWHEKTDNTFTVQRFEGLYLDLLNVKDKPILGYGIQRKKSFIYETISPAIITSNGIIKPLAQLGLILGILFFLISYKSTVLLCRNYRFNPTWLLFVVIIISSVSYMFDSTPIMRALELYALYNIKIDYE